jgi:uncharacterized protein (TIGR02996 family)
MLSHPFGVKMKAARGFPMSEEQAFLKAIKKKPDDCTARLVYADWLQEHDDPRGELIRIEEELPALPIYSDRYWELKPRRRELLKSAEKPWLKQMGYGSTDYQPVFADVPSGWKERWRLLREYVERWYQIPMEDVGSKLKPIPKNHKGPRGESFDPEELKSVDQAFSKKKVWEGLPPSLREWILFIRELKLGVPNLCLANGDTHSFAESVERIEFYQEEGYRECYLIRAEDRHEPDPQVWRSDYGEEPRFASPRLTTFALHMLLNQYAPQFCGGPERQKMTKAFARRLAKAFPVRSSFDDLQLFERSNALALWVPSSPVTGRDPVVRVWVRPPANRAEIETAVLG